MRLIGLNLLLAAFWMLLSGSASMSSLLTGLVIGFLIVSFHQALLNSGDYAQGAWALVKLAVLLGKRLVLANIQLARDILRPKPVFRSAVIAYRVEGLSHSEMVVLGAFISLTPGTLTIDLDETSQVLYVHSLYAESESEETSRFDDFAKLILQVRRVEAS